MSDMNVFLKIAPTPSFWSALAGNFVNFKTGDKIIIRDQFKRLLAFPEDQAQWNETLVETIITCEKDLLANGFEHSMIYVNNDVSRILESSVLYVRAGKYESYDGTLCRRMNVYRDRSIGDEVLLIAENNKCKIATRRIIVLDIGKKNKEHV